ncbi:MAG: hypothetical protein MUF33_02225 [Candidatus Nanopelagicales bacterium]|jgi:hypothetical protein|nr:hypothetical protein [Candidatus Nanopelagicales bacterium]
MTETQLNSIVRLPFGQYQANRYDTDTEHVLTLWRDGETWDVRVPRPSAVPARGVLPGRIVDAYLAAPCGCVKCVTCGGYTEWWVHDDSL